MAAATKNREQLHGDGRAYSYGVASGIKIYAGTLAMTNLAGYLIPANTTSGASTTQKYVGINVDFVSGYLVIV
jgi:hypothetical protein